MYSSSKRRRIKPFARPTSFDFNAAYDIRHFQRIKYGGVKVSYMPIAGTDEAYQVMEGEVLMHTQKPGVRRYGDHQMHVFSFANGLESDSSDADAQRALLKKEGGSVDCIEKAAVLRHLKYAGVAVTGFQPEKDVFEQGFVVTVAGLNTLFNNGASTLYPGDIICADIPNPTGRPRNSYQTGIPHGKLQFVVSPYRELQEQIGKLNASKFIMGTALSYAKPGDPVDVVLHKCNAIMRGITPAQCAKVTNDAVQKALAEAAPILPAPERTKKGKNGKRN
jgi:hypothetical protein